MGCNCRKAKKIHDSLTNGLSNDKITNKLGLSFGNTQNYFARTFQGLIVFVLLLVIFPLILVYLLITYIISGSYSLYIPNFISKRL